MPSTAREMFIKSLLSVHTAFGIVYNIHSNDFKSILFRASGDFQCHMLVAFANSLDPDQAQHVVGPDLDPNWLTL